jgi:stress response protein YsnF
MTTPIEPSMLPRREGSATGLGPAALALIEESARIEKRDVQGDRVRVSTHTDFVEEHVRETLRTDEVEVMRVAVNRLLEPGENPPAIRTEGNVTIVQVVIAERRLLLKEEVHILRDTTAQEVEVPVTLRKQRASVERTGPDGSSAAEPV